MSANTIPDTVTDVLIIGGGPAGLSAALSIYRFQHTIKIFDFNANAPHYENPTRLTPGFEGKTLTEIREICRRELDTASELVSYEDALVRDVRKTDDDLFELESTDGRRWLGRTLLIATGARDVMLDIAGYQECFAKTVYVFSLPFPPTSATPFSCTILIRKQPSMRLHLRIRATLQPHPIGCAACPRDARDPTHRSHPDR
jgi:alkyl hydroperoxide reductase subunit AhpF